jgi:uncharacterized secreted protein with C-terminal beta-propeller domain
MIPKKRFIYPIMLVVIAISMVACVQDGKPVGTTPTTPTPTSSPVSIKSKFTNFSSEEELREYISSTEFYELYSMPFLRVAFDAVVEKSTKSLGEASSQIPTSTPSPIPMPTSTPGRVSTTNVQVVGIDEPDIVKTDGNNIYISNFWYYPLRFIPEVERGTKIIRAFPPEELEEVDDLKESGNLLLYNNTLIIFSHDKITAYDVSEKPNKVWKIDLNSNYVSARLYNGKIYLITKTWLDYYEPCPIKPVAINGNEVKIACTEIYHPPEPIYSDITYNIMVINPENGEVTDKISFVGSSEYSIIYMSQNAIYITYMKPYDRVKFIYEFLKENGDLVPKEVIKEVERILSYDISNRAKSVELDVILSRYKMSLDRDERLKFENEYWNRLSDYQKKHKRELEKTEIVKVSLDLRPLSTGEVPGRLLNQFSLDEYNGYLRVATTVSDTNDLYILNGNLKIVGKILDYGESERIYAVRFIGDKGYIVTFRQTDPLFVMDLSNPTKPEIKGELKIPGYSSYLHPISNDLLLGVGKEGAYVKISLFDVSNPENPVEKDKYTLKEYWSDILNTHHAFLLDSKHEVFFLPGGNGGYIFSYADGIELVKAVENPAIRAIYIDDYMYIIGEKIVVIDENTWKTENELDLT